MGGRGTVTGRLEAQGNGHKLQDMKEITGKWWGMAVGAFNNTAVDIVFSNNDTFELKSGNSLVMNFFGGVFSRF
jgi:hypothetical protein